MGDGSPVRQPTPSTTGLVFWVSGDVGLVGSGGKAASWTNRATPSFNADLGSLNNPPTDSGPDMGAPTLDGIPGVSFPPTHTDGRQMYLGGISQDALKDRAGNLIGYGPGNTQPRTWIAVLVPVFTNGANFDITGGSVGLVLSNPHWTPLFDLEDTSQLNAFYLFSTAWRNPGIAGSQANQGPNTAGGVGGIYNGTPLVVEWGSGNFPDIDVWINGVLTTLNAATIPGVVGVGASTFIYGSSGSGAVAQWQGYRYEDLVYDFKLSTDPTARTKTYTYLAARYPSIPIVIP